MCSGSQEISVHPALTRPGGHQFGPEGRCPSSAGSRLPGAHFRNNSKPTSQWGMLLMAIEAGLLPSVL